MTILQMFPNILNRSESRGGEEDHLQDETLVCLCIHELGPWPQLDEGCDQQQAEQMLVEIAAVNSGPHPA